MAITIDLVTDVVCSHFGVRKDYVLSTNSMPGTRKGEYVEARHYSMFLCKKFELGSHNAVGTYFKRDHASITHALKCVQNDIKNYRSKQQRLERMIEDIHDQSVYNEHELCVYPDYINN